MGPFAGLRVVEFGQNIAGPYCAQLLADGGADVVKVEPPGGDPTRRVGAFVPTEGRQFLNKNRGKRSVVVAFQHPEAPPLLQALVARADVVISNLRPGLMEALGLDYETVAATRPDVIYAEVTAFGPAGPMAGQGGYDGLLQSVSGIAATLGPLVNDVPGIVEMPTADYATAMLLAFGISTALFVRGRTGRGQKIDASLLASSMVMQNNYLLHVDALDTWRDDWLADLRTTRAAGAPFATLRAHRTRHVPETPIRNYCRVYATANGFVTLAALTPTLQAKVRALLGVADPWMENPSQPPPDPVAYARDLAARAEAVMRTRTTAEWIETFLREGIPAGRVAFPDELFDDPQVAANGYLVTRDHPALGAYRQVAPPVALSGTPMAPGGPSPALGHHTDAVLREAGIDEPAIARLRAGGVIA